MKQLLLTATLFMYCFAFAQRPIFRYEPPSNERINTSVLTDEKNNAFYFIAVGKDFIERVRLSEKGRENLLRQGDVSDTLFKVNSPIGSRLHKFFFDKKYVDVCVNDNRMIEVLGFQNLYTYFIFLDTDLSTGASNITDTIRMSWAGDFVCSYQHENTLVLVEKPKNKPFFLFHSKTFGERVNTDTLVIDLPAIGKTGHDAFGGNIDDFTDINFGSNIQVVRNNLWLPLYAVPSCNKAFVQNGRLDLTLNTNDLSTWLVSVDLRSLSYKIRIYKPLIDRPDLRGSYSSTACIVDSFLITGYCNNESINYAVYNIKSTQLIHEGVVASQNFQDVSAGPALKVGDFWSRSNLSEISLTDFTKKAAENQLIIEGSWEKNELFLTFGSMYKIWVSATLLGNLVTGGTAGFAQTKPPSTVFFHTSWLLPSFNPTRKPAKELVWDKMLNHVFANRLQQGFNFTYMNGFYYIGYFSTPKREYQLYRFDEKME